MFRHGCRVLIFALMAAASVHADGEWPGWRGPHQDGHVDGSVPVKWDAKSIVWKTALPGIGQSSPAIWGDRIFLTAALEKGKQRVVLCVDRKKGDILWQHTAWTGTPEETHKMNGWASATCATDGERVYAFFGKGGLHCYNVEGSHVWSRDLGQFPGKWGTSACPLLVGELVIQNCDAEHTAFLIGLDKRTGKEVWKTKRSGPEKGGWSTPVLVNGPKRQEIVLNGETAVIGYDPANGKELWRCKSFNGRGEPTVAPANGLVYVVNGLAGDVYAVKTGGTGDVTKSLMAWHTPRKGNRDQPSPIVIGKYLLVCDMKGFATCYDNTNGKVLWKERLRAGEYTASPIAAKGLAYFIDESGVTTVIEPGPKLKVVAENPLDNAGDSLFRASPAAANGQLFLRSHTHLYCIGQAMP